MATSEDGGHGALRPGFFTLAIALLGAICYAAVSLEMQGHVHLRYFNHAFPTVLSHQFYGLPWDYSAFRGLAEFFNKMRATPDGGLAAVQLLSGFNREIYFFPFDDKGYADLTRLGFTLFGIKISSVFWAYATLFCLSVLCYLAAYWRDISALALLCLILAGLYAGLYAFPVSLELGEVTNPRALGLLSIVALAHLLVFAFRTRPSGVVSYLLALLQAALAVFVFFCRSPESWQLALVITTGGFVALWRLIRRRPFAPPAFAAGTIVASLLALFVYQKTFFNSAYFSTHGQTRLVWHNVLIGFALHPGFAARYRLAITDNSVFDLVRQRAASLGIEDKVFVKDNFMGIPIGDFVTYDRLARDIVLDFAKEDPVGTLATFAIYKPWHLWKTLMEAAGRDSKGRADIEATYLDKGKRRALDAYYRLLRPIPVLTIAIIAVGIFVTRSSINTGMILGITGAIFLGSLIPPFASYPLYHVIGTTFVTAAAFMYALAVVSILKIASLIGFGLPISARMDGHRDAERSKHNE